MKPFIIIATTVFFLFSGSENAYSQSETDSLGLKQKEIERYLQAIPPRQLIDDMTDNMLRNIPSSHQEEFVKFMKTSIDMSNFEKILVDALSYHFSLKELSAMADFYSSPVGKSIMSKFGNYMADVMPLIQSEMQFALGRMKFEQMQTDTTNQIRLSYILIKTKDVAQNIYNQLQRGANFSELAREYSLAGNLSGGDMGYINPDELMIDLREGVKELDINSYSYPIKTESGYFILLRTE